MNNLNEGIAFVIGEDLGYYGLKLPEDASPAMLKGYQLERSQRPPKPADRFVRKWLQLRVGAWRRNRIFDANVTPQLLRELDTSVCPITGVNLTHGTGQDTDWSIDRLNNDGAYTPINLMAMSTLANLAKGTDTLETMVARSEGLLPGKGLSEAQWARLAYACAAHFTHLSLPVRPVRFLAPCQESAGEPMVFLLTVLSVTSDSASRRAKTLRGVVYGDLDSYVVPGYESFLATLKQFAARTPVEQRTTFEFCANDARWNAFKSFWQEYFGSKGYLSWNATLAGEAGEQCGVQSAYAALKDLSTETLGYC